MTNLNSFDENGFVYCSCGNLLYGKTQPCYICRKQMKTILTIAKIKADRIYVPLTILAFFSFTYASLVLPGIFPVIINAIAGILSIVFLYCLKQKYVDLYIVRILGKLNNNLKDNPMEVLRALKTDEDIDL